MGNVQLHIPHPVNAVSPAALAVAPGADLDTRWAAWLARGRAHEHRVRQRLLISATALTIGGVIVYGFLRS
jgi:hypothetical protein